MVKKKQKLSRSEFSSLLKKGKRIHGSLYSLMYSFEKDTKLGVVVSKKTARKAVERNKLRRKMFVVLKNELDGLSGVHVAVFTKPVCTTALLSDLQNEMSDLLKKVHSKR